MQQAGYSSVGRASGRRLMQQSDGPWVDSGWPGFCMTRARITHKGRTLKRVGGKWLPHDAPTPSKHHGQLTRDPRACAKVARVSAPAFCRSPPPLGVAPWHQLGEQPAHLPLRHMVPPTIQNARPSLAIATRSRIFNAPPMMRKQVWPSGYDISLTR